MWAVHSDFILKGMVCKGEKSNFAVEKPDRHYLYQLWTQTMISYVNSMCLYMKICDETDISPLWYFSPPLKKNKIKVKKNKP